MGRIVGLHRVQPFAFERSALTFEAVVDWGFAVLRESGGGAVGLGCGVRGGEGVPEGPVAAVEAADVAGQPARTVELAAAIELGVLIMGICVVLRLIKRHDRGAIELDAGLLVGFEVGVYVGVVTEQVMCVVAVYSYMLSSLPCAPSLL